MANPLISGPEPNGSDISIDAGDAQLAAYESRPAAGGGGAGGAGLPPKRGPRPPPRVRGRGRRPRLPPARARR
ncbi:MAG: hypothetical protein OXE50_14305, partial [Chloroflexi bacterium]|nr:hypothetical protein [Chloroflexota bacterium]